jgi:hypothetical protein
MKKNKSKKAGVPSDPVATIFGRVFYLLQYLRTMAPQRLNPPSVYENGFDGEIQGTKPTVDRCWKEFDNVIGLYLQTMQTFSPKLQEIQALRMDPIVSNAVFRTFADKQRNTAFLDDAIEFITKGFHLFRRLYEMGGAVAAEDRTEEVYYRQVGICSRIWEQHDYDLSEIKALEAGLRWELATIENRRNPIQSTLAQTARTPTPKDPEIAEKEKDLKYLQEAYLNWKIQQAIKTGRKKFNASEWFSDFDYWTDKAKQIFDKYSEEYFKKYGEECTDEEALDLLLDLARKKPSA